MNFTRSSIICIPSCNGKDERTIHFLPDCSTLGRLPTGKVSQRQEALQYVQYKITDFLKNKIYRTQTKPASSRSQHKRHKHISLSPLTMTIADLETKGTVETSAMSKTPQDPENFADDEQAPASNWTPAKANYPEEDETYPFLESITTMRTIKGYVNDENLVPATTYSFIVTSSMKDPWPNLVNVVVFLLQFASYLAVTVSIIDPSDSSNPFNLPANVTPAVRGTQLLSIIYSILVQQGIIKALYTLRNGFDEAELRKCFPHCARSSKELKVRWHLTLFLIGSMGCYAQFLTFTMIMQSSDVLGVLLNYAAVSFIATIDNEMFALGKRGWLGKHVETHVRLICLADNPNPGDKWYQRLFHTIGVLFFFIVVVGCWIGIANNQTNGQYLSKTVRVEFDDLAHPSLGTFSGYYDILLEQKGRVFSTSRSFYFERKSEKAFFGFCAEEKVWAFSYNVTAKENVCTYAAKSSTTENFDIVTTSGSQWYAKNPGGRTVPLEIIISEWDCKLHNHCGSHGTCVENRCECDEGYYGLECNFLTQCPRLEIDRQLGPFQGQGRKWSSKFEILRFGNETAVTYDHPVYVTENAAYALQNNPDESEFDIIFFTGRRWALAFSKSFYNPEVGGDLESYLQHFHAHFDDYEVAFLSENVDAINENLSPEGLNWFQAEAKKGPGIHAASSQVTPTVLRCTDCDAESNPCFYDGICQADATCMCSEGSEGGLCEVPPVGNGRCDPFFNTVTFDMDGGDCCEATCKSTPENICGKDETGFLDTGFFFCENEDPLPSEFVGGEPFSEAGGIIALAENGSVLAAVMGDGEIGLFDKLGAQWMLREMIEPDCSVHSMAMASGPFASNPIFVPPVVIVMSCKKNGIFLENVYDCNKDECSLTRLKQPPEAKASEIFVDTVGISTNGGVIAVSYRGDSDISRSSFVDILRAKSSGATTTWSRNNEMIFPSKGGIWTETLSQNPSHSPTFADFLLPLDGFIIYEAEDADEMVKITIGTRHTPFSGDSYADMDGRGASLEWNVNDLVPGLYEISLRYATPNNRRLNLYVDGINVATFDCAPTPTWSDWTFESKSLGLIAGNHKLKISADESEGPNIDLLALRLLPPTEAPSASAAPSTLPSTEPSDFPSTSPTVVPNQLVLAMSLSGSGEAVAIVVGDIVDGISIRIYVYRFDGTEWVQQGPQFNEMVCSRDISTKDIVRLSRDGKTLLFNGGNVIKIYDWDKGWTQRGEDLEKTKKCSIENVALSTNGQVIAVSGSPRSKEYDPDEDPLHFVVTYAWLDSKWTRREQLQILGSPEGPLVLDGTGRRLAVGKPLGVPDLSGGIQTYEYPRYPCHPGEIQYRITFTTKLEVTRWTLDVVTLDEKSFKMEGGPYFFPNYPGASGVSSTQHDLATVVEEICVPDWLCANLTVYPTDFGGFNVLANGVIVFYQESVDYPVSYVSGPGCVRVL